LEAFFPADAAALQSLGCGAGINVPVFEADVLLGSVNAFHQAGWFTPKRVASAQRLAADFFRNDPPDWRRTLAMPVHLIRGLLT
jgi:hypothetical protein